MAQPGGFSDARWHYNMVPEEIKSRLGFDEWKALSWMLQHEWIQNTKFKISAKEGEDAGTPFTVDQLLNPTSGYGDLLPDKDELSDLLARVPPEKRLDFRRLLIEGYLLGTDYASPLWVQRYDWQGKPVGSLEQTGIVQDRNGANQLTGELKRYWIRERGIFDPRRWNIPLSTFIVYSYCDKYDLPDSKVKFIEKLGIKP